ncbi:hypothetical protein K2O51_30565 [Cupriavidus pinatubonensis]|uniref:hypothetical protein n=1 Tax=Cupriavidus pinatubonensis TaxID=248026 RepID=UPI001C729FFF|nr:hypothetical protein [Cupriavidus pinatubonensis]QYY31603.1 hypothetical protein K2O51_30565 [Cupriavidus pinatubonensis]
MSDAKRTISALIFLFTSLASSSSMPASKPEGAYSKCMTRTKNERLTCISGCGMIVQDCYDEGMVEVNEKINSTLTALNKNSNKKCAHLATEYLNKAMALEADMTGEVGNQSDWFAAELKLHLVQQRLATVQFILKNCT